MKSQVAYLLFGLVLLTSNVLGREYQKFDEDDDESGVTVEDVADGKHYRRENERRYIKEENWKLRTNENVKQGAIQPQAEWSFQTEVPSQYMLNQFQQPQTIQLKSYHQEQQQQSNQKNEENTAAVKSSSDFPLSYGESFKSEPAKSKFNQNEPKNPGYPEKPASQSLNCVCVPSPPTNYPPTNYPPTNYPPTNYPPTNYPHIYSPYPSTPTPYTINPFGYTSMFPRFNLPW